MTTTVDCVRRDIIGHQRRFVHLVFILVAVVIAGLCLGARTQPAGATATTVSVRHSYDDTTALRGGELAEAKSEPGIDETQAFGNVPAKRSDGRDPLSSPTIDLRGATEAASDVLLNSSKQLQAKFKHAADFGVAGNYSKVNATKFSRALNQHINSSSVTKITGTYRGSPVTHFLDQSTGLNVIVDPDGVFISRWKLGSDQLKHVLSHGGLT